MDSKFISKTATAKTELVTASALFALGYLLARRMKHDPGTDMLMTQSMIAGAIFLSLTTGRAIKQVKRTHIALIFFNGVGTAITCYLVLAGTKLITPALASIIVISNVLMVAVIAWVMGRKRFSAAQTVALITGFLGVTWISLERSAAGGEWTGVVYLLISAVLIAVMTVAIEIPSREIGGATVTRWTFWVAVWAAVIWEVASGGLRFYSVEHTIVAVLIGSASMALPTRLFNEGMGLIGAADAAAYKLLIPLFALVYAVIFLGEIPTPGAAAGGAVVVLSVAVYQKSRGVPYFSSTQ